jgi:hypothetical protein
MKQVTWYKSSLLLKIIFQNTQMITTKLKWKLFTKVIRGLSQEPWSSLIKREV